MNWLGLRKKRSVHFAEYVEVKEISIASASSSPVLALRVLSKPHSGANYDSSQHLRMPSTPPQRSSSPHHFRPSTPHPVPIQSKTTRTSHEHVHQGSHHLSHTPSPRQQFADKAHHVKPPPAPPPQKYRIEEHHHLRVHSHHAQLHHQDVSHRPPAKANCTTQYIPAAPIPQRQRTTSAGAITLSLPTLQYYSVPKTELNHVHIRSSPPAKYGDPQVNQKRLAEPAPVNQKRLAEPAQVKHRHSTSFHSNWAGSLHLQTNRKERPHSGYFVHPPPPAQPSAPPRATSSYTFVSETVNINLSIATPHGVRYQEQIYPSGEYLYHAFKFSHRPQVMREFLKRDFRPDELAQRYREYERGDWSRVRTQVMKQVVELRFSQHKALRAELAATGTSTLAYRPDKQTSEGKSDTFWGIGDYFNGRNEYGEILMDLRARLVAQK